MSISLLASLTPDFIIFPQLDWRPAVDQVISSLSSRHTATVVLNVSYVGGRPGNNL